MNCLSVFDHFVGLALKRLNYFCTPETTSTKNKNDALNFFISTFEKPKHFWKTCFQTRGGTFFMIT